jgi:hypothetical protein
MPSQSRWDAGLPRDRPRRIAHDELRFDDELLLSRTVAPIRHSQTTRPIRVRGMCTVGTEQHAAAIVDADVRDVVTRRSDVVEHHRHRLAGRLLNQRGVHLGDDHCEPRRSSPEHRPDTGHEPFRTVAGVGRHELMTGGVGTRLDRLVDVEEERFSMFETMTPMVRLRPPARLCACRLGLQFSSCITSRTRARVVLLTTRRCSAHGTRSRWKRVPAAQLLRPSSRASCHAATDAPSPVLRPNQWNRRGAKSCRFRRQVCHSWSVPGDSQ